MNIALEICNISQLFLECLFNVWFIQYYRKAEALKKVLCIGWETNPGHPAPVQQARVVPLNHPCLDGDRVYPALLNEAESHVTKGLAGEAGDESFFS